MNNIQTVIDESHTREPPKKKTGYTVFSIIRKIIIYLFVIVIVIGAFLFAMDNNPKKNILGYRYYTVLTPSMQPTYKVGDLVFVKMTGADNIKEGDVITFNPSSNSSAYLTHRVTEKIENYEGTGIICFRTKGDANDSDDSFLIDENRVIGKVTFSIPKLGYIIRFVQLRWYFIVPLIIILWLSLHLFRVYFRNGDDENDGTDEEEQGEKEITT